MKKFSTNSANPTLISIIRDKLNEMLAAGKISFENLGAEGVKEVGRNAYIDEQDEEKYNAMRLLQSFIYFKNDMDASVLYEFSGFSMNGQKMRLVVPIVKASELADKAKYIEETLSDYGVKFPTQLYQLSKENRGKNLPGKDFPPPIPKTMDTTDEQYEKYLEEFYKQHGVEKKSDGLAFRVPYPHEQVEYGTTNDFNPGYMNEQYREQLEIHAKGKGKTISAPVGEKLKVRIKSLADPELKAEGDKVKSSIKWQKIKSNVLKVAAVGAGVVGATVLLNANPIGLAMLGTAVGIGALARYVRNKYRKKKIEAQVKAEAELKERQAENRKKREEEKAKEKAKEEPTAGVKPPVSTTTTPVDDKKGSTASDAPISTDPVTEDDDLEYDLEALALAEDDLRLDNEDFILVNNELMLTKAQIAAREGKAVTEEEKKELHDLKAKEIELMKRRLELAKIMVGKQQIMLDNFEHSARKR